MVDELNALDFKVDRFPGHYAVAASSARYVVERGDWKAAAELQPRQTKFLYSSVFALWVVYLVILLTTPVSKNGPLHLSDQAIFIIRISVALSYLITWMAATNSAPSSR